MSFALSAVGLLACAGREQSMDPVALREFGTRYAAAWSSQDAARVASFFEEHGSLTINDGAPSVGRAALTTAAQGFMTSLPDMVVTMDTLIVNEKDLVFRWTLTGTNTGPSGTGNAIRISGFEEWTIGPDGLIAASLGHYDAAEYARQIGEGAGGAP